MNLVPLKVSLIVLLFSILECFGASVDTCVKSGSVVNGDKTTSLNIRAPKQNVFKVSFHSSFINEDCGVAFLYTRLILSQSSFSEIKTS